MRIGWWAPAAGVAAVVLYWSIAEEPQAAPASPETARSATASSTVRAAAAQPGPAASGSPFTPAALAARQDQQAMWQQRLERAQATLAAYRESTRYPYESQPAAAHADQMHPNQPVEDEVALRLPNTKAGEGVMLRTTQERVFVQGMETVRFTVSVRDQQGKVQPLRVLRSAAREVPADRTTAATFPDVPLAFNDEGSAGDASAADGVHTVQLQPATQGFGALFGQIRVEVFLEYKGQQGQTYFDIMYTPSAPATWQGGVREVLEDGSLGFHLKANVKDAGRYVVTARVDDASGKPFALLSFNGELPAGVQDVKLPLYGKLVRDGKPAFPLKLRDVEAFLLIADAFPDRRLMPRLQGVVHTSKTYALSSFSDADWTSEERERYIAELSRDLADAQKRVDDLGKKP